MNGYVELSDYQVAALPLRPPSQITSDVFAYSDPYAAIAYIKELEQEAEEQHNDEQELIKQNVVLDRIEEEDENDEDNVRETFESEIYPSESDKDKKKVSTNFDSDRQAFGKILMYKVVHNELEQSV